MDTYPFASIRNESAVFLRDINASLAAQLNADESVIVVGTPDCGDCRITVNRFTNKRVNVVKHNVADSNDPIIVATKQHLGVTDIRLPIVFKRGQLAWTGMDGFAITNTIQEFTVASAAA